jgi:two-component system sensor histidine kinase TctE
MRQSSLSLHRRLLLRLGPSMLLLFALGGIGAYLLARRYSDQVYDSWLYDSAQSLKMVVRRDAGGVMVDLPAPSQQMFLWNENDITYFSVISASRGLVAGTATLPAPPPNATSHADALLYNAAIAARPVRVVTLLLPATPTAEAVQLSVAETTYKRGVLARRILLNLLGLQGILLMAASVVIWRGVGRSLQPLHDIALQLDRHDDRSLQPVPDSRVPVEVQPLTQALNSLLSRLERSLTAQRRFIADAAHQLRTPLAGLQLTIEQAQHEADPATLRKLLATLRISTERAIRLANQMLALSRAEPEAIALQTLGSVELRSLVREVGAEWVPAALKKNIDLGFNEDSAQVEIIGSGTLLREALNNLIDNAIKYHQGDGTITLSVIDAPQPAITVDDDGRGIPEQEREHVLKRFYRVEQRPDAGAGLGLAIVKQIAEAHRAELDILTGTSGKGTLMRMRFPRPER